MEAADAVDVSQYRLLDVARTFHNLDGKTGISLQFSLQYQTWFNPNMLVAWKNSIVPFGVHIDQLWNPGEHYGTIAVGIAVEASIGHVNNHQQTWVVLPITIGSISYVEVEIVFELEVVKQQAPDWKCLKSGSTYDTFGYPVSQGRVSEYLYQVWDDGATKRTREAKELFRCFEYLIEYYKYDAKSYLVDLCEAQNGNRAAYAISHGWDLQLIDEQHVDFPYTSSA